ncbi:MAG: glycosyltransferase family 1 protein [Bacteroidota bacterium]
MPQYLHIVSFDVPFPANYGGVIDVYYKLVWLKKAGVKVYLHCFNYGRSPSAELGLLCEKVFYYERKTGIFSNLGFLPYNVKSRLSDELTRNLLADKHPILFEVLHTCYLLSDTRLKDRKKVYRHSNIEHDYYNELSVSERNFFKKIYLKLEALRLRHFEPVLRFADLILAVNQKDTAYFKLKYPSAESLYLPSFHPNSAVEIRQGKGDFILFHGNLGVSENYEAAQWLISEVFSKLEISCVIAGLNPPAFLKRLVNRHANVRLIANPDEDEMKALVRDAHIHMLYTAQPTGLKLKLLNVLFNGRFVICNGAMVAGTGVSDNESLFIRETAEQYISTANSLIAKEFSEQLLGARCLQVADFDNDANCRKLTEAVFSQVTPVPAES